MHTPARAGTLNEVHKMRQMRVFVCFLCVFFTRSHSQRDPQNETDACFVNTLSTDVAAQWTADANKQIATTWGHVLGALVFFINSCHVQFFVARLFFSRSFVSPPSLVRLMRGGPRSFAHAYRASCRMLSNSRPVPHTPPASFSY